jgi:hypothetical protein
LAAIGIVVALALGAQAKPAEDRPPLVTRVHGIATGIATCWRPPHEDDQVTVRLSFTRDGAVIGERELSTCDRAAAAPSMQRSRIPC